MTPIIISTEDAKNIGISELFRKLSASKNGLSSQEASERIMLYGPNEIPEKKVNPFIKFLGYFWGPIPWMIEAAVIMSAVINQWNDFFIPCMAFVKCRRRILAGIQGG